MKRVWSQNEAIKYRHEKTIPVFKETTCVHCRKAEIATGLSEAQVMCLHFKQQVTDVTIAQQCVEFKDSRQSRSR